MLIFSREYRNKIRISSVLPDVTYLSYLSFLSISTQPVN